MNNRFTTFKLSISEYELPKKFTFPFYYEPHPLAVLAANELQEYLKTQTDFDHNFGIDESKTSSDGSICYFDPSKDKLC